MTSVPSFAVVGAGAAGALIAGLLAEAGHSVTLVARGESLEAIRRDGVRLVGPDGRTRTARPAAVSVDDPAPRADLTIFLVKSYDTRNAMTILPAIAGEDGYVLCLQNGVENEDILAERVGRARVLPGVLYVGAERLAPGVVTYTTEPTIVFGRGDAGPGAPITETEAAFTAAGIVVQVEPDILAAKWRKFVFNCGLNPLTAATGRRLGAILASEDGKELFAALVDEAIAAGSAAGAPVGAATREAVFETARRMNISSSMAEDLAAGRPLELEAFCGYVRRLGIDKGARTPVTDVFYRLLKIADAAKRG